MLIPALVDASTDPELRGTPIAVYLRLVFELDLVNHRPVKQEALANELQLSTRAVRNGIQILVDRRYLERGPDRPGEPRTFRLVYNRKQ